MIRTLCVVAVMMSVCLSIFGATSDSIGTVVALQGQATAVSEKGSSRMLKLRAPIYLHDTVTTMAKSKLQIMLNDETIISLGEDSVMTIDEYVYSPSNAKENATSVNIVQGIFRVITGRITKLNPDRFRVKTSLATIGIRGCDVGFRVTALKQDFYIIDLHGYESVVVQARDGQGRDDWQGLVDGRFENAQDARQRLINVLKPNRVVSVTVDGEMEEREIAPEELQDLLNAVMPEGSGGDSPDASGSGSEGDAGLDNGSGEGEPTDSQGDDAGVGLGDDNPDDGEVSGDPSAQPDETLPGDDFANDDFGGDAGTTGAINDPDTVPDPEPDLGVDDGNVITDPVVTEDTTGNTGGTTDTSGTGGDTGDTTTDGGGTGGGTPIPSSVYTTRGSGAGWEWGVWETEGALDSVDFRALQPISQSDFTAIANGTMFYDLSGSGAAAASILHNGSRELVEGTSSIFVQVGQGVTPTWDGDFSMNNTASDSLSFSVLGIIQPDGRMTGNQYNYMMQVHGTSFDGSSISAESISGVLVGPGSGSTPITGTAGTFSFDHGGAAQVQGGFGADLAPAN